MTGNNCLLDTSIVIQLFKANRFVKEQLNSIDRLNIPVIAVGELLYGAYKSSRLTIHLTETENFLLRCNILFTDRETAGHYGKVKARLMEKGHPIPENDIWIAATALQHNLPLFTADAHFREVDGLQLFNPLSSV